MSLSIEEFRTDSQRIADWAAVLAMPITMEVLQTLRENGPEFRPQTGMTPTDAGVRLGHICGYAEHHQRIEEMAERWPLKSAAPEPDYKAPGEEEE